ncbi:urease accessory protein UreD [Methylobacillus arboreus]|uniref:urease accessory protein UreD n=1 Tax=Methylobacillus arboreus TaxID=755170 RepID=UPI001E60079F|nr:urease accessory protein UreD [Methylobacillus arboreus]
MDDAQTKTAAWINKRWQALLALEFAARAGRTTLVGKRHQGPLVVQKMLYPEGDEVCHGIIIHPPGGVAGGDQLQLQATLETSSHALLTTPGAGKWYKANQLSASQDIRFKLAKDSCLEWLPQENILFDGSNVRFSAEIELAVGAVFCGWDILCFGRQARGEQWNEGELRQGMQVRREGRLIWNERLFARPDSLVMHSGVGLRGMPVSGSLVVAADVVPADVVEACRAIEARGDAHYGVTALPEVFAARYIGRSSEAAREYFERLWQLLRPWYAARPTIRPRIWNT